MDPIIDCNERGRKRTNESLLIDNLANQFFYTEKVV